jgi:predicted dehydrogenase
MPVEKIRVLLVGLGQVGMKYDLKSEHSQVLTHLKAIRNWVANSQHELELFGIDSDVLTEETFKNIAPEGIWLNTYETLKSDQPFNLAVIATPIHSIAENVLDLCKKLEIQKVVIEKPAAKSLAELATLNYLNDSENKFIVGFPRPSLRSSNYIRETIKLFGEYETWKVDIYYGGGVLNILSHFLNLVEFFFSTFELESHSLDNEGNLHAEFKSKDGSLNISTHKYSDRNDEKNRIEILGPLRISYLNSGREIRIYKFDSQGREVFELIDASEEISQMIGVFGNDYMNWAVYSKGFNYTNINSNALYQTIKLSEVSNG